MAVATIDSQGVCVSYIIPTFSKTFITHVSILLNHTKYNEQRWHSGSTYYAVRSTCTPTLTTMLLQPPCAQRSTSSLPVSSPPPRFTDSPNARSKSISAVETDTFGVCYPFSATVRLLTSRLCAPLGAEQACHQELILSSRCIRRQRGSTRDGRCSFFRH
jgi:hypothetical protein